MCDPVLIAAILEELGHFDEKNEKEQKRKISDKEGKKIACKTAGQRTKT